MPRRASGTGSRPGSGPCLPLPFWASRAAFLVDDEETTTGEAIGGDRCRQPAAPARSSPPAVRRRRRRRPATPALDPRRPATPIRSPGPGRRASLADGRHELADRRRAGRRSRHPDSARIVGTSCHVDGGDDRPAGGEARVRLRRHADVAEAPPAAARRGRRRWRAPRRGGPRAGSRRSGRWPARWRLRSSSGRPRRRR